MPQLPHGRVAVELEPLGVVVPVPISRRVPLLDL